MKNILKKLIFPLMLTPIVAAPLAVTACTNGIHDINKDVDNTDLGFVEDLSSKTIMKAFIKKNPRVKVKNFLYVRGDSHQGVIANIPQGYYEHLTEIPITYRSKLSYAEDNKKQYEISNENNQIIIKFKISDGDKLYDKNIDKKISCFSHIEPYEWKTFEHRIDKATKSYQIIISLNSLKAESPEPLSKYFNIDFRWGDRGLGTRQGIVLGTIDIEINS